MTGLTTTTTKKSTQIETETCCLNQLIDPWPQANIRPNISIRCNIDIRLEMFHL